MSREAKIRELMLSPATADNVTALHCAISGDDDPEEVVTSEHIEAFLRSEHGYLHIMDGKPVASVTALMTYLVAIHGLLLEEGLYDPAMEAECLIEDILGYEPQECMAHDLPRYGKSLVAFNDALELYVDIDDADSGIEGMVASLLSTGRMMQILGLVARACRYRPERFERYAGERDPVTHVTGRFSGTLSQVLAADRQRERLPFDEILMLSSEDIRQWLGHDEDMPFAIVVVTVLGVLSDSLLRIVEMKANQGGVDEAALEVAKTTELLADVVDQILEMGEKGLVSISGCECCVDEVAQEYRARFVSDVRTHLDSVMLVTA